MGVPLDDGQESTGGAHAWLLHRLSDSLLFCSTSGRHWNECAGEWSILWRYVLHAVLVALDHLTVLLL